MKRLFAFMMALVLVLSLSVSAFATETDNTGSITITNATIGQTYAPYKIFDASISGGEEGGYIYTITKDNQFFDDMFGDPTDPNNKFDANPYFTYDAQTGVVRKRATAADGDVLTYLKGLIYEVDQNDRDGDDDKTDLVVREGLVPAVAQTEIKPATDKEVKFENLPYGYYLITSTLGTMVTIDSTNPDVEVIDKNQKPGDDFTKLVWDEDYSGPDPDTWVDEKGVTHTGKWVVNSTANIGDLVDFKVQFHATNYNGENQVQYYRIHDTKGNALWVEFNSITVNVEGKDKPLRGYYYGANNAVNTKNWDYFGDWSGVDKKPENAEWFLIHRDYDDFDIVIPWMSDFRLEGIAEDPNFKLTFGEDAESIYASSATVTVKYRASVEPGADIDGTKDNLFNKVTLSWKDKTIITPPGTPTTNLAVHALGITKTDGAAGDLLSGATFEIYRGYAYDEATKTETYSDPVYVIPTDIKGVYILDDLYTIVSGEHRETSRKTYEKYLADYLKGAIQKNEVVTQVNGKLVILGLEEGTYYLKETAAPDGYNLLTTPVEVTIGADTPTIEYAFDVDKDGNVVTENAVKTEIYKKVANVPVTNNKGAQLPATGGQGTMMLITTGTMIAMAFAVLLITHKKMSVYHD